MAASCTVARLMRELALRGVVRGHWVKTTIPVATLPCPADRVNRVFRAPHPNALWVNIADRPSSNRMRADSKSDSLGRGDGEMYPNQADMPASVGRT